MKTVHLICNAHLDPIWQWEWEEGAAAALSTFSAAADLAEEFDYIFCHNEVTLYKYIEEYAPELFARIKKLIREGKWHIMGGWYLQPDCNMPQGESFIRQIRMGQRYFEEKFGITPTTAINFDSFGHTRGLVQIMTKCGQDSYILTRPGNDPIPARQFVWEGFDGSTVKVNAGYSYNSPLGSAAEAIRCKADQLPEDTVCVLWGVGNHGGGPSRKDLRDIEEMQKKGEMRIIHSTPEQFFAEIDPKVVHDRSLRTVMPGCYTSMSLIKRKHAELENTLWMTEKICSVAAMRGLIEYPERELDEVVEDLLNCEFHDVLPGSSVRAGEENGLRLIDHGLLILTRLRGRAFFALCSAEPKAKEGEFPVLVFNPHPYVWETDVTCELSLADQNWNRDTVTALRMYDQNGNEIPVQLIKEESNINLDWRKRFVFRAALAPLTVSRFSVYTEAQPRTEKQLLAVGGDIIVDLPGKYVVIDGKTGLLCSYRVDGREYLREGGFCPVGYTDNPDPWGMQDFQLNGVGSDPEPFVLMQEPDGPFAGMKPVQIIEDGPVCLTAEAFFRQGNSRVRLEYRIDKHSPAVDVRADVFPGDCSRMIRLAVPCAVEGTYIGQTAFGTEPLYTDGRECVAQRFVALREDDGNCLALLNRGTYGSIFRDGCISVSLLRTATYCAHPIGDYPIIPTDRFVKKIDMAERNFEFRLTVASEKSLERLAAEFNQPPYALNAFPIAGKTDAKPFSLTVNDPDTVLVTVKKAYGSEDWLLRLFSNQSVPANTMLTLNGASVQLYFGKYEVKTVRYDGKTLREEKQLLI